MSSNMKFGVLLAVLLSLTVGPNSGPVGQSGPPKPLEFEVADGPGAPSDIPGISKIEVALIFTFDNPAEKEDIESLSLRANGIDLPTSIVSGGHWDNLRPLTLRLIFLLENVLKGGVQYLPDSAALRFECVVTMLGGARFSAASTFDFAAKEDAPEAHRLKGRFAPLSAPGPIAPLPQGPIRPPASPSTPGLISPGAVTVYTSKPNPDKKSPFDEEPLAIPVAGADVVCEYTEKGKTVRLSAMSDKNGQARFEVPLDIPVTLTWGAEKDTATCTAKAPKQSVVLGGVKLKTVSTSPIKK